MYLGAVADMAADARVTDYRPVTDDDVPTHQYQPRPCGERLPVVQGVLRGTGELSFVYNLPCVWVEDHDVRIRSDGQDSLARVEPEPSRVVFGQHTGQILQRAPSAGHACRVRDGQQRRHPRTEADP